jgi:hypothetical protein
MLLIGSEVKKSKKKEKLINNIKIDLNYLIN